METDNKSSIFAFLVALPLILCLSVSSASGAKLYTGGEKYEKDDVNEKENLTDQNVISLPLKNARRVFEKNKRAI